MDEDDNDELLQQSDDESMTESEETCQSLDKPQDETHATFAYTAHTTVEFIVTKVMLILSSTVLLILLPMYQESMNVKGNTYTIILFNASLSLLLILLMLLLNQRFCPKINNIKYTKSPLKNSELMMVALVLISSGFLVLYSLNKKRVLCHLQDPMKGLLLVFSLIYYFFFCKKLMGLQRIFSSTTVIVGLFITVDYGLCNEFRCRGNEREKKSDDAGVWSWQTHSAWAAAYIAGLALFAAFFMLLDRFIVTTNLLNYTSLSSQFLSTISRLVSFQSLGTSLSGSAQPLTTVAMSNNRNKKEYSATHIALWLHLVVWFIVISLFWVDIIPSIGTSTNLGHFLNQTSAGLSCAFALPQFGNASTANCGNTSLYAWMFLLGYVAFILSSLRFLIICQSAVHTVATISVSLPISGIWWSLFKTVNVDKGIIIWYPTISGELICALLGLPIITIGLGLLAKSHFADWKTSRELDGDATLRSRHLA